MEVTTPKVAESTSPSEWKRKALAVLVPEAFSEGRLDADALKRTLGDEFVVQGAERYVLDWAGKSFAYRVLQSPTTATLRPQPEESIAFDDAVNVFIEGENLETLKVLQKAYFGEIKLVYVDAPYNTGSDSFIYPDRFEESRESYLKRINDLTDDGTLMREGFFRKNSRENGRFHSNWLSMMLPRLYIAKNLLRDDGFIFLSCDDNEVSNLRLLLDEVFGEENFASQIIVQSNKRGQTYKDVAKTHEYLMVYSRTEGAPLYELPKEGNGLPFEDSKGRFDLWELRNRNPKFGRHNRPNLYFPFYASLTELDENGYSKIALDQDDTFTIEVLPRNSKGKDGCWRWSALKVSGVDLKSLSPDIVAKRKKDGGWNIYEKSRKSTTAPKSIWDEPEVTVWTETDVISEQGTVELGELGLAGCFDHPKPRGLMEKILRIATDEQDLVMDLFAGSASMADAVMHLNAVERSQRKWISIQLPEPCREDSDATKAGFKTIADVARERIRRAGKKLMDADRDLPRVEYGFKSLLLAPSNFKQWRGDGVESPTDLANQIALFTTSEKQSAQSGDILVELMLKFGQPITAPIDVVTLGSATCYHLPEASMLFVLGSIDDGTIRAIVDLHPAEVICIDSVFDGSDPLKTNLELHCRDARIRFACV